MIAILIPIDDATHWQHTLAQYQRQAYANKRLVVVANGCKVNVSSVPGAEYRHHQKPLGYGAARNACLDVAREIGAEMFAFFDAGKDEYDEQHLDEISNVLATHDACGCAAWRCRWLAAEIEEIRHRGRESQEFTGRDARGNRFGLTGGSIAGVTDRALPFDAALKFGEDLAWSQAMIEAGRTVWSLSADGYTQVREGGLPNPKIPVRTFGARRRQP